MYDGWAERGVLILDGGMSNALEDRGVDLPAGLWTAGALREAPEEVHAVHLEYFAAGAHVATTASYQASVPSLVAAGMGRAAAEALILLSVTLARAARDEASEQETDREGRGRLLVAASVGPYGAVGAGVSEYRGRYGIPRAQLREFHLPRLELLAEAGPDFFAVETIPDVEEAEVLVPLLDEVGLPASFSYTVRGEQTRAGQPLEDAFAVLRDSTALFAAGVNCSAPQDVLPALEVAGRTTGLPGVAYPNRGEEWDSATRSWRGSGSFTADLAGSWVEAGAGLVGGCCRVGPTDIAGLAERLRRGR